MRICRVKYWHGNWIVVLIEIQSALSASSKLYASRRFHKMDVCEFSCDWKILVCEIWPGAERREGVSWSRALGSGQCVGGATGTDRHFMHSLQSQNCVYLKVNAFLCISFFTHCGSVTHSAAQTQAHDRVGLCSRACYLHPTAPYDLPKPGHKAIMIPEYCSKLFPCNIRHSDQTPAGHDC